MILRFSILWLVCHGYVQLALISDHTSIAKGWTCWECPAWTANAYFWHSLHLLSTGDQALQFLSELLVSWHNKQVGDLFPSALCIIVGRSLPSVHLVSFFCQFSLPDLPLFYQGRSETHGVHWQLFKQPCSLSKGRCLHWSESCLFSSGRCFPLQAWAGTKMALYQKHELGNQRSEVAKDTIARHWQGGLSMCVCARVCVCVCTSVYDCAKSGRELW